MTLPQDFTQQMKVLLGEEEFKEFEQALNEPCPTSIRLNPLTANSISDVEALEIGKYECRVISHVPWCHEGIVLSERPSFTMDPMLHAGTYYVQEASSMFVAHIVRQFVQEPVNALDLCAAPGGKSTLLLSTLPEGSMLVANEISHKRANILAENISKWLRGGYQPCIVTNNEAHNFRKLGDSIFDVILCDVPCSGEGMFRKDERAIEEWSTQNVEMCWKRQRNIISDIWDSLKDGGLLIYSTCTYNTKEDEDNVRWICENLGAEVLDCNAKAEWNITGNLLEGEDFPCYHFLPHKVKGEGFFCAALRKKSERSQEPHRRPSNLIAEIQKRLHVIPLELIDEDAPRCGLTYDDAIRYLQGEALRLPSDAPRGMVALTYKSRPLGMAKNIGNRANNLYPKEWRIRRK